MADLQGYGKVQVIGFDYLFYRSKVRQRVLHGVISRNPCPAECENRRIVLLHDPGGFDLWNGDENLMVFSGHTHGGLLGFLSCGLFVTPMSMLTPMPDNGLFRKGSNVLYVHRGQGSRFLFGNFVLRVGVPTEQSLMRLYW